MEPHEISVAKQELRKTLRAELKALTVHDIQRQSQSVWDRLLALPQYQSAKSIGLFLSMPKGEIDTNFIVHHALSQQKTVYVPRVGANFEHANMDLIRIDLDYTSDDATNLLKDWPRNKWNIPEPPSEMPLVTVQSGSDVDLLVMPGLAFDRQGRRLGQGKGYYDRFLERMWPSQGPTTTTTVAVGLQPQLRNDPIPTHDQDRSVHVVLVPDETIFVSKPSPN